MAINDILPMKKWPIELHTWMYRLSEYHVAESEKCIRLYYLIQPFPAYIEYRVSLNTRSAFLSFATREVGV